MLVRLTSVKTTGPGTFDCVADEIISTPDVALPFTFTDRARTLYVVLGVRSFIVKEVTAPAEELPVAKFAVEISKIVLTGLLFKSRFTVTELVQNVTSMSDGTTDNVAVDPVTMTVLDEPSTAREPDWMP